MDNLGSDLMTELGSLRMSLELPAQMPLLQDLHTAVLYWTTAPFSVGEAWITSIAIPQILFLESQPQQRLLQVLHGAHILA